MGTKKKMEATSQQLLLRRSDCIVVQNEKARRPRWLLSSRSSCSSDWSSPTWCYPTPTVFPQAQFQGMFTSMSKVILIRRTIGPMRSGQYYSGTNCKEFLHRPS